VFFFYDFYETFAEARLRQRDKKEDEVEEELHARSDVFEEYPKLRYEGGPGLSEDVSEDSKTSSDEAANASHPHGSGGSTKGQSERQ
jgi:hypothetical protein